MDLMEVYDDKFIEIKINEDDLPSYKVFAMDEYDEYMNYGNESDGEWIPERPKKPRKSIARKETSPNSHTTSSKSKIDLEIHEGENPYVCELCGDRFEEALGLKAHSFTHAEQESNFCYLCGIEFTDKSEFLEHMLLHSNENDEEKPLFCKLCGEVYNSWFAAKKHLRVHMTENSLSCNYCTKRFRERSSLTKHILLHTGIKPFACDLCGRSFTKRTNLNRHMSVHTGQKNHACPICDRKFTEKANLKKHIILHTGIKPYSCQVCNRRFSIKSSAARHFYQHMKEKLVIQGDKVIIPPKVRRRKTRKQYYEENTFSCNSCDRIYATEKNLRKHMAVHSSKNYTSAKQSDQPKRRRRTMKDTPTCSSFKPTTENPIVVKLSVTKD